MTRLTNANTDQLNQLAPTGRGQAFSEALATRNQPITEITALLSSWKEPTPSGMRGPYPRRQASGAHHAAIVNHNTQTQLKANGPTIGDMPRTSGWLGGSHT